VSLFFLLFLWALQSDLGLNMLRPPLLRRWTIVLNGLNIVNIFSHRELMDSKLYGNVVWPLTYWWAAAAIASLRSSSIFLLLNIVLTHLNAPDQHTAKTSALLEVLTLADDKLIKCIWLAARGKSNNIFLFIWGCIYLIVRPGKN